MITTLNLNLEASVRIHQSIHRHNIDINHLVCLERVLVCNRCVQKYTFQLVVGIFRFSKGGFLPLRVRKEIPREIYLTPTHLDLTPPHIFIILKKFLLQFFSLTNIWKILFQLQKVQQFLKKSSIGFNKLFENTGAQQNIYQLFQINWYIKYFLHPLKFLQCYFCTIVIVPKRFVGF